MNAKSNVKVLFAENVIEINKIFDKARSNPLSDEYALLQKIRADYPNFTVRVRQIKKNAAKESYPGLTYEYMRDYIILHSTPEEELAAVAEFEEQILISKCHSKANRYPVIKKWFLAKYPEVAKFGMITNTSDNENADSNEEASDTQDNKVVDMPQQSEDEDDAAN